MTLPRTITTYTKFKTPLTRKTAITFSRDRSSCIFTSCRKHSITVGSVLPVLGQMGSTRVLHRRYLRGEITEEQWRWYYSQPFHTAGPLSSRPFLDREWYEGGGAEAVVLAISIYSVTLPSIPTVSREWLSQHLSELEDGMPPFSALLPRDRFVRRAQASKKQTKGMLTHPLHFEIWMANHARRIPACRAVIGKWEKLRVGEKLEEAEEPILDFLSDDLCFHNGGSSMGNVSWVLRDHALSSRFFTDRSIETNGIPRSF